MIYQNCPVLLIYLLSLWSCMGCNDKKKSVENKISIPVVSVSNSIEEDIRYILAKQTSLPFSKALIHFYTSTNFSPVWINDQRKNTLANSLQQYLDTSYRDGLFKSDYHFYRIDSLLKMVEKDSVKSKDNRLWAEADILYTTAYMHILQDLRQGRLHPQSMALENDTASYPNFFDPFLKKAILDEQVQQVILSVQNTHPNYLKLKEGIRKFSDSMDKKMYTYLSFPFKKGSITDSISFIKYLQLRLSESGVADKKNELPDSSMLVHAIKKYQLLKKLAPDGMVSATLIKALNNSDLEKFKRIAITLDRFKQLPATMPANYIWVNLPAYKLEVWENDSIIMESKIICGKAATPTPFLTSAISDLVIFPTWTVPQSIITKEILPGLKKSTGYLAKKGLNLINNKGEEIDPATVIWSKYSKGIPYKIQQGSGDNNALGVIKFNFTNPYSVYLHDTNQRYLFKNGARALSHGCVRVQEWEKLAYFIIRNDSMRMNITDSIKYNVDTIKTWIKNKERHRINVKFPFPLFIRYFGCEGKKGAIKFYDDIYGEDKIMRERFFSQKSF